MRKPTLAKLNPEACKKRTCLRCNKDFMSLGPQNRICPDCSKHTPKTSYANEVSTKDLIRSLHLTRKLDNGQS